MLGVRSVCVVCCFFFNDPATTEICPLSLHDALPICGPDDVVQPLVVVQDRRDEGFPVTSVQAVAVHEEPEALERRAASRSEEHTSELQSRQYLVCRLLLEKKNTTYICCRSTSSILLH